MFIRTLILAPFFSLVVATGVVQAADIPAIGAVDGLVIETLSTHYSLRLEPGTFGDCQTTGSGIATCVPENGTLRLSFAGETRVLPLTKVMHFTSRSSDTPWGSYTFRAQWRQEIDGFQVDTPVLLTVNYDVDAPAEIRGYIKSNDLNVSHQVLMKRVDR